MDVRSPDEERPLDPTLLTLGDGRGFVASGGGAPEDEIYANPTGWSVAGPGIGWPLYPHLHLLQDGRVFHSGMRLGGSGMQPGFLNPTTGVYTALPAAAIPPSFERRANRHRQRRTTVSGRRSTN